MAKFARGSLVRAVEALTQSDEVSVAIMTGCFIPEGEPPAAETDGPIGAALLAFALSAIGVPTVVLTDDLTFHAAEAAVTASRADAPVGYLPPGAAQTDEVVWNRLPVVPLRQTSHVISIERLGPAADGVVRSMRGTDRTAVTGLLHVLFEQLAWCRISVGDGGNEIGMGNLPHNLVASSVPLGEVIHCRVSCDALIVAGCSNWGAFGLLAALAVAKPRWITPILTALEPTMHEMVLSALLTEGPAVDGITRQPTRSVDGLSEDIHEAVLRDVRALATSSPQ